MFRLSTDNCLFFNSQNKGIELFIVHFFLFIEIIRQPELESVIFMSINSARFIKQNP